MKKKKVVVRARDGDSYRLVHVAYVQEDVYNAFLELAHDREQSIAEFIESWAQIDFNRRYPVTNLAALNELKNTIRSSALQSIAKTDMYAKGCLLTGSINAWVTEHMRKELDNGFAVVTRD